MSARARAWEGSRARSKAFSSAAASGSTDAIWSITSTRPPGRVTRASSATASSGRAMWCSVRSEPARSNEPASSGSLVASPSRKLTLGSRSPRLRPCSSSSGTRSTATTSRTCGASASARAPAPAALSSTRSSPSSSAKRTTFASSSAARASWSAATRSAVLPNRSCAASCIVERLLLRSDRTRRPLLLDLREQAADLRPRRQAELVAAQQGLCKVVSPRRLDDVAQLGRAHERERLLSPGLGRTAEAVDGARIRLRPLGPQQRRGEAAQVVRDGEAPQPLAEDGDEPVARRVPAVDPRVHVSAQRLQQPDLVEAPIPLRRKLPELCHHTLARRTRHERRVAADELLRSACHPEAELVLEAHGAQEAQRVVLEDRVGDRADAARPEVAAAVVRVDSLVAAHPLCDRVDAEVAAGEVVLDRPRQRREVDGPAAVEGDAPGAVALREGERLAAGALGVGGGGAFRLADGDVEVHDRPSEFPVAHRAADDPGFLAREQLLDELTHRRPPSSCGADPS